MKELIKNLRTVWKYTKGQRRYIGVVTFMSFTYIAVKVITPIYAAKQIVALSNNMLEQLLYISIILFAIESVAAFLHFIRRRCTQKVFRETFVKIQTEVGKEILKLQNSVIDKNSSGVFIQRLTDDTENLSYIFNVINRDFMTTFSNVGIFVAIFVVNKIAFVYIFLCTLIMFLIESYRTKKLQQNNSKFKVEKEKVTGFVGELVRGIRDIKMLNAEDSFMNELNYKVVEANKRGYITRKYDSRYNYFRDVVVDCSDLGLIVLLIGFISNNIMEAATALVIYNYASKVTGIIDSVGRMMETIKDFNLSSRRVFAIIDSKEGFNKEAFGTENIEKIDGNFEFKHVKFSYEEGQEVLRDVNFKINSKETVAFVGKSGAGKTTIFNLICKMYEVNDGEILIDGKNINDLNKDSIRGNVTIISQNPYIFNLSIKDNFRLVKADVTDEEMQKACKVACLGDFIESLPNKYETIIGEGGVNLSGGQKQRLAIARALVQDTRIILFDEATSALDNETQSQIQKAIENLKDDYTILIVAHRLSTVINSDRIMFLNNGVIEAEGSHKELMEKCKNYHDLYEAELRI